MAYDNEIIMVGTKGKNTLLIYRDYDCKSPREWDTLGHLILFGRDARAYGDKHNYKSFQELMTALSDVKKIQYPVYAYIHGGVTFSIGDFGDPWDSGCCGIIYVAYDEIEKEYGEVSEETIAKAKTVLQGEIEMVDMYATGDTYGFRLLEFDTEIDSCWGFYGKDGIKDILADNGFDKIDMRDVRYERFDLDDYLEQIFNKEVKWSLKK